MNESISQTTASDFNELVESYKLAIAIYYQLFAQGLLDSKTVEHQQACTLEIAAAIREAKASDYINFEDDIEPLNEQVANLFFKELELRGREWSSVKHVQKMEQLRQS